MNPTSTQQAGDAAPTKTSEWVVQSGTLRTGSGLAGLGCAGLSILWVLQIWESTNRSFIGEKVFVATLGSTALVMGSAFVILPFITAFAIGI
jgi:hypothetical protein